MLKDGIPFLVPAILFSLIISLFSPFWGIVSLLLPGYVILFFRNPKRTIPEGEKLILAPADGKVVEAEEIEEAHYLQKRIRKIGIFMSPFDVHVNRIPCAGTIRKIRHQKGNYRAAFEGKASYENERNAVWLETRHGKELLFVQVAGFLARRIVCRVQEGQEVTGGEPFGMIRFGSRLDLYLPLEASIAVRVGDRVKGGETVLGRFL